MSVKVEVKTLDDLQPDPNNVNKHTQRGHALVENSLRKRGAFRSVAAAGKGVDKPVVMAGNLTIEKARDAGFEEVIFVHTTGKQLVSVIRDDIAPGSAEAIALGLEDNESGKQSYSPDVDILAALAAGDNAILSELRREDTVFNRMIEGMEPYQVDYEKEWEGMPEHISEEIRDNAITCIVRFLTEDARKEFEEFLGWKLSHKGKTYSTWYPKSTLDQLGKGLEFTDEP